MGTKTCFISEPLILVYPQLEQIKLLYPRVADVLFYGNNELQRSQYVDWACYDWTKSEGLSRTVNFPAVKKGGRL